MRTTEVVVFQNKIKKTILAVNPCFKGLRLNIYHVSPFYDLIIDLWE